MIFLALSLLFATSYSMASEENNSGQIVPYKTLPLPFPDCSTSSMLLVKISPANGIPQDDINQIPLNRHRSCHCLIPVQENDDDKVHMSAFLKYLTQTYFLDYKNPSHEIRLSDCKNKTYIHVKSADLQDPKQIEHLKALFAEGILNIQTRSIFEKNIYFQNNSEMSDQLKRVLALCLQCLQNENEKRLYTSIDNEETEAIRGQIKQLFLHQQNPSSQKIQKMSKKTSSSSLSNDTQKESINITSPLICPAETEEEQEELSCPCTLL